MAARSPRRIFANPFVVTLAALPACYATSTSPPPQSRPAAHGHHGGHGEEQPPPRPVAEPATPQPVTVVANPPRPQPTTPVASKAGGGAASRPTTAEQGPPAPATYSFDQRWTITRSGDHCLALASVECPKPTKRGAPVPTCNPPPPIKYSCPANVDLSAPVIVIQRANQAECTTEPAAVKCPPQTMCNPPPPKRVACPGSASS